MSRIGVIGLGIMGGAMARHLLNAGHDPIGFDIDPQARSRAAEAGIAVAESLNALCDAGAPLLLSLPSPGAAHAVCAVIAESANDAPVIDTSTLALNEKRQMAVTLTGGGNTLLDCPISGTGAQMAARDAIVYASGDGAALRQCVPFLTAISRQVIDLGSFGNGTAMKLIANHLVAIHNVATAEAMRLGIAAGIDPEVMIPAIEAGAGQSRIFSLRAPMIAADTYEPATMKMDVWSKDMETIAAFARDVGAPTPLLDAVAPLYARALGAGLGALDTAAVARVLGDRHGSDGTE